MFSELFEQAAEELSTIQDFLRFATSQFQANDLFFGHGTDNAWDEAVALLFSVLHLPYDSKPEVIFARLTTNEKRTILSLIEKRIEAKVPVPYLTQEAWFAHLPFYVDQRVLIPRSPFAELIEQQFTPWVDPSQINRILDLCTGSGCMAIAAATYLPETQIDAVDISADALAVAEMNVKKHQLAEHVNLIESNLFSALSGQSYDIIMSNPPYVSQAEMATLPAEYKVEPSLALSAGVDGLDIVRTILKEAPHYLTPKGMLFVEVGNSADAVMEAFPDLPLIWLEFERGDSEVFCISKEQLDSVTF
ncbi:MAG: 50S ribosomal protein L3 N(5)-glutamine methyltransferase [Gammaproteobacteria bacterium]